MTLLEAGLVFWQLAGVESTYDLLLRGGLTVGLLIALIAMVQGKIVAGSTLTTLKTDYETRLVKMEQECNGRLREKDDTLRSAREEFDRRLSEERARSAQWQEMALSSIRNTGVAITGLTQQGPKS